VAKGDTAFSGSIASIYDDYLGPLIFEPYAQDLANRLSALRAERVLETAAGTGIVTHALLRVLSGGASVVATDLNQPMLDRAAERVASSRVSWQKADAQSLPFPDGAFDAVVCQFGVMFFPDKQKAFREARRVLRPGGRFIFNVWDGIEHNEFADLVNAAVAASASAPASAWQLRCMCYATYTCGLWSPSLCGGDRASMDRWVELQRLATLWTRDVAR